MNHGMQPGLLDSLTGRSSQQSEDQDLVAETGVNRRVLVLGLGNPLMGDDGAGLAALECLRCDFEFGENVQLEDGGTLGLSLLPMVEDCASLLVLDAVRIGRVPGTVVQLDQPDIPMYLALKTSPHQTGFRE